MKLIESLRQKAGKATPGKWQQDETTGHDVMGPDGKDVCVALCKEQHQLVFDMSTIGPERRADACANAAFIAACSPEVIAALCDAAEALENVMPLMAECDCIYSDRDAPLCPCRAAHAALAKLDAMDGKEK